MPPSNWKEKEERASRKGDALARVKVASLAAESAYKANKERKVAQLEDEREEQEVAARLLKAHTVQKEVIVSAPAPTCLLLARPTATSLPSELRAARKREGKERMIERLQAVDKVLERKQIEENAVTAVALVVVEVPEEEHSPVPERIKTVVEILSARKREVLRQVKSLANSLEGESSHASSTIVEDRVVQHDALHIPAPPPQTSSSSSRHAPHRHTPVEAKVNAARNAARDIKKAKALRLQALATEEKTLEIGG